jgi:hypothetical protein
VFLDTYILDADRNVVAEPDPVAYATWEIEHWEDSIVRQEQVGAFWVSTTFLGVDLLPNSIREPNQAPECFETMAFQSQGRANGRERWKRRSATWAQAIERHEEAVAHFRKSIEN